MKTTIYAAKHLASAVVAALCIAVPARGVSAQQLEPPKARPNILMIVADDMNWDTPGSFGGTAPEITPNIDRLAAEGMRFGHAYVNATVCTPSRSVLLSGLYPSNNGAEGFQRILPGTPTLPAELNKAGYLCGIIGKPLRQQEMFRWSVTYRWPGVGDEDLWGRDPAVYRRFARDFFAMARNSNQPFFLMANSHDPHRPFAGGRANQPHQQRAPSSRTYRADEVRVPGFLPDLPVIRRQLADYATSARRLDDMVGGVLDELAEAELAQDTIVIFLSDNGMPFPGAKFNCYPYSVRTPLIVRWPSKVEENTTDREHMVSAVDLMSTILEAVGLTSVPSDGRSFLALLRGESQADRDHVFAQFDHIHGADALPIRSVLTRDFAYIFNPWSNGQRRFTRLGHTTIGAMREAATSDSNLAAHVRQLEFRTVEEFYNLENDPSCLFNLLEGDRNQQAQGAQIGESVDALRAKLREWMVLVEDPALHAFDHRDKPEALEEFILDYRARAAKEVEALKPYEKKHGYRF